MSNAKNYHSGPTFGTSRWLTRHFSQRYIFSSAAIESDVQYRKPGWYIILQPQGSQAAISPVRIPDFHMPDRKGIPQKVKFRFQTPKSAMNVQLKVYAMNDSYIGLDWEGEAVMQVMRKRPSAKPKGRESWDDNGDGDFFGCSTDIVMDILGCQGGKTPTPAELEKLIRQFMKRKGKKQPLQGTAAEGTDDMKGKPKVEPTRQQRTENSFKFNDEDDDLRPAERAYAKQRAFVWWQENFAPKRVLSLELEDLAQESLGESGWYENTFCDPTDWYISQEHVEGCEDPETPTSIQDEMMNKEAMMNGRAGDSISRCGEDSEDIRESSDSESDESSLNPSDSSQEIDVVSDATHSQESLSSLTSVSDKTG